MTHIFENKFYPYQFNLDNNYPLEQLYQLCVHEIGLQQSKRDQIIGFYIALIGLVIPNILKLSIGDLAKGTSLFVLFILGCMLISTLIRYRVYKEVYWITSRTILQLFNFKNEYITKEVAQTLFFKSLEKNYNSVIVNSNINKPSSIKTYKKNMNSAESILYHVLVLITSITLFISIYITLDLTYLVKVSIASGGVLFNIIYWAKKYTNSIIDIYKCILSKSDNDFNSVYSKAWFLHMFVDNSLLSDSQNENTQ